MNTAGPSVLIYLFVATGGALGAMSRYWLQMSIERLNHSIFPLGTFSVNVIGSLLLGIFFVLISEKLIIADAWRPLIMIGFLGAMTTFSTFSLDALLLFQQGHYNTALVYTAGSVLVCFMAAAFGMMIARLV